MKFECLEVSSGKVYRVEGLKTRYIVKIEEMFFGYNAFDIYECKVIHIPPQTYCTYTGILIISD